MLIIKKSNTGINTIPISSVLLSQRKIFLSEAITNEYANEIIQQLLFLESESDFEPIDILISSPGGEVNAGLMIYDQIKGMDLPVRTYCTGLAASMAAVIFAGGKERYILPHSKVMLHEPLVSGTEKMCSATSIERTAEAIIRTKELLVELLSNDTGRTKEEIEKAIAYDNYMNANEALEFGLCDKIVERIGGC